jgi:hypothetical protein
LRKRIRIEFPGKKEDQDFIDAGIKEKEINFESRLINEKQTAEYSGKQKKTVVDQHIHNNYYCQYLFGLQL